MQEAWYVAFFPGIFLVFIGIWKIIHKKQVLKASEKLCANIPDEDAWIREIIKLIDKGTLYFAIPSIILGICLILESMTDLIIFPNHKIHNTLVLVMFIGILLNVSMGRGFKSPNWGILNIFKSDIADWYEIQEFRPMKDWQTSPIKNTIYSNYSADGIIGLLLKKDENFYVF